ncbi:voltage-gated hydrogen channel 1 [Sarcophilus harrisii]|uniref:Voltage-gated hydrogen channel 1 n=1 Tax=Sarcophilus harrisii TaxID=9305 RepID=G3WLW8_SARHA|nr:voltage-gated hydrogen channel 1 [Sarcophilus harrisii]XP_031804433.1 voltage-gated hydrogen channel 1 [Sarcophilus harrisii]XP_031804434.1 voltage-gated hydrogen channel 1 [Sarcophilus harrisii]
MQLQMSEAPGPASVAPIAERSTSSVPREVPPKIRTVLRKRFKSKKFQVFVVTLVLVDIIMVFMEALLDLKILEPDKKNYASKVSLLLSTAIMIIFMIEMILKLYTFCKELFYYKFEILDVVVVIICFSVRVIIILKGHFFEALQLLILLRLWRVVRIVNGRVVSSTSHSEQKLSKLKVINHQLTMKIQELELICSEKDQEILSLKRFLRDHGLPE